MWFANDFKSESRIKCKHIHTQSVAKFTLTHLTSTPYWHIFNLLLCLKTGYKFCVVGQIDPSYL